MATWTSEMTAILAEWEWKDEPQELWPGWYVSANRKEQQEQYAIWLLEKDRFPALLQEQWGRFWGERELMLSWQAPSLLRLRDFRVSSRFAVLVYEPLPQDKHPTQQSLETFLQSCTGNRLQEDEAVDVFKSLTESLQFVHQQGMIHRFLHPCFVYPDPTSMPLRLKLSHYGLSKLCPDPLSIELQDGASLLDYMAPELLDEPLLADHPRLDVYALGALLWRMLFGEPPLPAEEAMDVLSEEQVSYQGIALSIRTKNLLQRLLAIEPEERPSDARAVLRLMKSPDALLPRGGRNNKPKSPKATQSYRNFPAMDFGRTQETRQKTDDLLLHKLFDTFPEFSSQMQLEVEEARAMSRGEMARTQETPFSMTREDKVRDFLRDSESSFLQTLADTPLVPEQTSGNSKADPAQWSPSEPEASVSKDALRSTLVDPVPDEIPEEWEAEALEEDAFIFAQSTKRLSSSTRLLLLAATALVVLAGLRWMCHS